MFTLLRRSLRTPKFHFASLEKIRNIGISAHIDSGKTTFTERVLYYSGRIDAIHEVKGSDGVGATMDFMELERERGITIQSAATHLSWKDHSINLIDTPGHVDFTIEVERALRVLDGGVLIVCGVAGVQAQTFTVHKQMERYRVPRVIFVNKLDRMGASPYFALNSAKSKLGIDTELIQIPIGEDSEFKGVVDIVKMKAFFFEGASGNRLLEADIPDTHSKQASERRKILVEKIAEFDNNVLEKFLNEEEINEDELKLAIRKATLERKFAPMLCGSAYKNKGVQLALDAVLDYLPSPSEVEIDAFERVSDTELGKYKEVPIKLNCDSKKQFVALAFKLEENKFGQLTYIRVYQGKVKRGDVIYNTRDAKRVKVSRMVKMHANAMEEVAEVGAGEIFALFGVDCASGTTFIKDEKEKVINLSTMFVPDPVLSLSLRPKSKKANDKLQKALKRFQREDPTFTFNFDAESEELQISGMGELHLQIYCERLKREYEIEVEIGAPTVNYRETVLSKIDFNYLHKKQTGGAGQFARVIGYFEPIYNIQDPDVRKEENDIFVNQFQSKLVGQNVPGEYVTAVEKQFYMSCEKGPICGYPIINSRMVLVDGETHVVDSSSNAFMIATKYAIREAFKNSTATLLEPLMKVDVSVPVENYQPIMNSLTRRKGNIFNTETQGEFFMMQAMVPLSQMFGFASELRGFTQGQGEFGMEYVTHEIVSPEEIPGIIEKVKRNRA